MLSQIKCMFRKNIFKRKHHCSFSRSSFFNQNTFFEGYNSVKQGSQLLNCYVGSSSYISSNVKLSNVSIGKFSCIGPNVENIVGNHPTKDFVSVHPAFFSTSPVTGKSYVNKQLFEEFSTVDEQGEYFNAIGNDVWIGAHVLILNGVSISDGAIIAAGSVVSKDVPPYAIVGGVPAKLIRYRFKQEQIAFQQKLQWWNNDDAWFTKNAKYFSDIDILMKKVSI